MKSWGHRIDLDFLPAYSPETNPIERVWWQRHETKTRSHRCQSIDKRALVDFQLLTTDSNKSTFYANIRNTFALAIYRTEKLWSYFFA
ncbi:MAG: transposase [Planctomycetaceae bacterium]|nr:transposase [Planctomycetaceae bacterium]